MAEGNTFGATALSSYGGFWISFAILLTPGGFQIEQSVVATDGAAGFLTDVSLFLFVSQNPKSIRLWLTLFQGWFIFTTVLLICTLKSTLAFFLLFFMLDLAFLMLAISYYHHGDGAPNTGCLRAGGAFGVLAAFLAWYNALAGIADTSNSFFIIPVVHFPWSAQGKQIRKQEEAGTYDATRNG